MREKRTAYFVDTPYQLFNVLDLYLHSDRKNADLYIVNQFRNAETLYKQVLDSKIFDNVILLNKDDRMNIKSSLKLHLTVFFDYLFPLKCFKRHAITKSLPPINRYKTIYCSCFANLVFALIVGNKNSECRLYEDGTGSYSGNIVDSMRKCKYDKLLNIIGKGKKQLNIKALYVHNVEMCKATVTKNILKMPTLDKEFLTFANSIFNFKNIEKYKNYKFIWLSEPVDGREEIKILKERTIQSLLPFKDKVLIRVHPRDKEVELYKGFDVDDGSCLWELCLSNIDIDDKVLIASYSTAQLTPKMIYNKEPSLIFLNAYENIVDKKIIEKGNISINTTKNSYKNPQKIYQPKTEKEFQDILRSLE